MAYGPPTLAESTERIRNLPQVKRWRAGDYEPGPWFTRRPGRRGVVGVVGKAVRADAARGDVLRDEPGAPRPDTGGGRRRRPARSPSLRPTRALPTRWATSTRCGRTTWKACSTRRCRGSGVRRATSLGATSSRCPRSWSGRSASSSASCTRSSSRPRTTCRRTCRGSTRPSPRRGCSFRRSAVDESRHMEVFVKRMFANGGGPGVDPDGGGHPADDAGDDGAAVGDDAQGHTVAAVDGLPGLLVPRADPSARRWCSTSSASASSWGGTTATSRSFAG